MRASPRYDLCFYFLTQHLAQCLGLRMALPYPKREPVPFMASFIQGEVTLIGISLKGSKSSPSLTVIKTTAHESALACYLSKAETFRQRTSCLTEQE